jgi:hypothetical protein
MIDPANSRLRAALEAHFHPDTGTPYWLDWEAGIGIDVRRDVQSVNELHLLGEFEREAWTERPLTMSR